MDTSRQRSGRHSRSLGAVLLLSALTVQFASFPSLAQEQEQQSAPTRVSPGASTRVWIMAAFDDKCQPLPPPGVAVTIKPAKGTISFREGQSTTIKSSRSGTCLGLKTTGTGVYYTANRDADGPDTFAIEARLATGEIAARAFQMVIGD